MSEPTTAARADYLREHFSADVVAYLEAGDGFTIDRTASQPALVNIWRGIFDQLVSAGYMRRSQTGRHWWVT